MKKIALFLLTLTIGFASMHVSAQNTLTVADGTIANSYIPIYGFYMDAYIHSQFIYPASLLTDMTGNNIEQVAFYSNTESASWTSNVIVKVGETTESTLSSFSTAPTNTVYTGTLSISGSLMTIVFTTPITYTGGNLLFDIATTTKGNYASANFYGISQSGASVSGYNYNDMNAITSSPRDFLPKASFTYISADITCHAPSVLTVDNITDISAIVTWPSSEDDGTYLLQYKQSSQSWDAATIQSTSDTSFDFNGILIPSTSYEVRVATNCTTGDTSPWRSTSFTTIQTPTPLPYIALFDSTDKWVFNNGTCSNYWTTGSVPGTKALFITNNGTMPSYDINTPSIVSVEKNFIIGNASRVIVSFDFYCGGESTWDYMKAFFAPANAEFPVPISPSSVPSWATVVYPTYAIDFSSVATQTSTPTGNPYIINQTNGSLHIELVLDNPFIDPTENAVAKLVFGWRNDNSGGNTPGPVITHLQVSIPSCQRTSVPEVSNIGAFTADVSWEAPAEGANSYMVQYAVAGTDWEDSSSVVTEIVPTTNLQLTDLTPNTSYQLRVATNCDGTLSLWQSTSFTTLPTCTPPTQVRLSQISGASALMTWTPADFGAVNYTVNYSEIDQSNWVSQTVNGTSFFLTDLQPNTNYNVNIYSNCNIGSADTIALTFTTNCLSGGNITIGEGNTPTGFYPSYGLYNYSYTQQLFTSAELGGAQTFHSIAFKLNSFVSQRNLQIYLTHTNATSVANGITVTNAQMVYSNTTNLTTGWNTFNFTTPFNYNGTDNLLLVVIDNTGSWNNSYNTWFTHTTNTASTYYAYQDGSPYSINTLPSGGNTANERNNVIFGGNCDTNATCIVPNAYISDVTSNSITVSWAAGYTESAWELQYSTDNNEWIPVGSVTSPYTLTELESDSPYFIRLRSICGPNEYSNWTSTLTVNTLCSFVVVTPPSPFMENFNTLAVTMDIPNCWDNSEGSTTNEEYRWSRYDDASSVCLRFNSFWNSNNYTNFLKTPVLNLTQLTEPILSFTYKNPAGGEFSVYLSTDGGNTYMNTPIITALPNTTNWTEMTYNLSNMTNTDNVVIVFAATSNYGNGDAYIYLDDIFVGNVITCPKPYNLTATASTISSITLEWMAGDEETAWDIIYGPSGFDVLTEGNIISDVTTNPYEVTGLDNTATYEFYIRAKCGENEVSFWSNSTSYSTLMIPVDLPYSTNFSSSNWKLNNGNCPNKWIIDVPMDSTNAALFITNDNSIAQYSISRWSVVSAEKLFNMSNADSVDISFDVNVGGESTWDYLKVFFAPSDVQYEPAISQTIYSPYDYDTNAVNFQNYLSLTNETTAPYKLNLTRGNRLHIEVKMPNPAPDGVAKLVFVWKNDESVGTQPGAIIENVQVSYSIPPCNAPININVANISYNDADLSWTVNEESAWNVQYKTTTDTIWSNSISVTDSNYHLSGLSAETEYQVRVQTNCGDDVTSDWTTISFTTAVAPVDTCYAPTNLQVTDITSATAIMRWTTGGDETSWKVGYKLHSTDSWTEITVSDTSYNLEGLTPESEYDVRVKAVCSADNQSDFATYSFITEAVGIDNITLANSISLMPNPANNYIELRINNNVVVKEAVVYNAFGQMIKTVTLTDNHARIDLSNMAAGMYFVRVNDNNVITTKKFIKK